MYTFPTVDPYVQPRQVDHLASLQRFQLCRHQLKRTWKMTALLIKCPVSYHKLQSPPAIHVAFTLPIVAVADKLIAYLVDVVEDVQDC